MDDKSMKRTETSFFFSRRRNKSKQINQIKLKLN